ncbi:hypothetical protein HJC23_002414 [Cyclotella cryptica]|uniref:PAS domain-containing protein n=1 Tax=Cyclotella cryptica TaxID=29204 RepID=A0ABD3QMH5_9STRA
MPAPIHQQLSAPQINNRPPSVSSQASIHQQQQELLKVAKLLATSNPSLAVAAMEQALAMGAQSQRHQQLQVQQPQQPKRGSQHQLEQFPDAQGTTSSQTRIAPTMSSSTISIKKNESNVSLKNAIQIDRAQKSRKVSKKKNIVKSDQGEPSVSMPARPISQSRDKDPVAAASVKVAVGTNQKRTLTGSSSKTPLPAEPVSLLTLQTWSREQLEAYVKKLQENNEPIPNTVRIVLEDARKRDEKKHAKRMANRISASTSRARKKQLIDELTAAHAKLRRHALILAHLPDPVVVIGTGGEIKFCSVQLQRLLKLEADDLLGSNIEHLIVPDSRGAIRRLIQDLVEVEQHAILEQTDGSQESQVNDQNGGGNSNSSRDCSNEANASQASVQSFPLLEVNVDSAEGAGAKTSRSSSSDVRTRHTHVKTNKASQAALFSSKHDSTLPTANKGASERNNEPPTKKAKTNARSDKAISEESTSFDEVKPSNTVTANVDDVMGSAVTANNADAKLSSLMHRSENEPEAGREKTKLRTRGTRKQPSLDQKYVLYSCTSGKLPLNQRESPSLSADSSTPAPSAGLNASEYSGDRESNESSDNEQDSSLISGNSVTRNKSGIRRSPLAPACNVCLIRSDLTTIWCELTSSIRTRARNDEDSHLGIIDHNPRAEVDEEVEASNGDEKELLLCLRPILEGEKVGEELRFPHKRSKLVNENKDSSVADFEISPTETK